ncbi:hypothetical protein [Snodgrassella sp. B3882]|nr:hypothetical protein [Snodgrassella sp. B3882]
MKKSGLIGDWLSKGSSLFYCAIQYWNKSRVNFARAKIIPLQAMQA